MPTSAAPPAAVPSWPPAAPQRTSFLAPLPPPRLIAGSRQLSLQSCWERTVP